MFCQPVSSSRLVGMDDEEVAHRHLLDGVEDDVLLRLVDAYQLKAVDGEQGSTVLVNLALGFVGDEVVALGEADNLANLACTGEGHAEAVALGLAIDPHLEVHLADEGDVVGLAQVAECVEQNAVGLVIV